MSACLMLWLLLFSEGIMIPNCVLHAAKLEYHLSGSKIVITCWTLHLFCKWHHGRDILLGEGGKQGFFMVKEDSQYGSKFY